jgi:hypothetical protein
MGISKLKGLKAHDYHVLMKQILPFHVCTFMIKGLRLAIIHMKKVFQKLCAKTIDPNMMRFEARSNHHILSFGKKKSSISFQHYDTSYGASSGRGKVVWPCTYSMDVPHGKIYEILKTYVQNMARFEGSMVEGYTMEEAIGFCKEYMSNFKTTKRQVWDDYENQNMYDEVPQGFR